MMGKDIVTFSEVEKAVFELREQKVILDSDVAKLYNVETMRVNEAVKNNPDKFPQGYIYWTYQRGESGGYRKFR